MLVNSENRTAVGDHIILVVSLVMSGVALSSIVALPSWQVQLNVLGSPLGLGLDGRSLLAFLLVALCTAGVELVVRSAPGFGAVPVRYTATFWILPALITLAATTAVPRQFAVGTRLTWLSVLALLGALLASVLTAEYMTTVTTGRTYRAYRLVLNLATYAAAFALYATIYGLQQRGLLSAPAVAAVTFPLAVDLLRGTEEQLESTWLYAAIVALTMGEITWALNWLGLSALVGGAALLLVFYAIGGLAQQHLAGRLTISVAMEFVAIALLGLLAVILSL